MMLSGRRIIWWGLYLLWGVMLVVLFTGLLSKPSGQLRAPDELLSGVTLESEVSWMSIYLNDIKIGYIRSELEPLTSGGYAIREYSRMTMSMMGAQQLMLLRMNVITDSTLAMISFDGSLEAAPYSTSFKGEVKDLVLHLKLTVGGETTERFFPAPEPLYVSQAVKPLVQAGRLDEGDSLVLAGFDPVSMAMQELVIIGVAPLKKTVDGREITIRKLITRMAGFESELHVNEKGDVLREHGPLGLMMRRESEERALTMGDGAGRVDFLLIYSISPKGQLTSPRELTRARYRLTGVDLDRVAAASDYQVRSSPTDSIISVNIDLRPGVASISSPDEYISDAPYIESRDPSIRKAARQAVQGGTSRIDSLNRLSEWVYSTLEKKVSAGIPSALAVLQQKSGDCNEHSVLFTAMARSLGIPCRIQLGVVYMDGQFFYHAWPAAWVDEIWYEFDPTFGLKRADAARISLASGDMTNAIELAGAIGKIGIEILSVP